ncbi:MAG: cell wall-binding repeat-containing protein [Raoultibacter sp.]
MTIRVLARGSLSIFLAALMVVFFAYPTPSAWAVDNDQKKSASEEEIERAFDNGEIKTEIPPALREQSQNSIPLARSNKAIKTLAGESLYDTAAAEARYAYSASSWAIVASGESSVDALAATSLAGALDCPILLTSKSSLPAATSDALASLGVTNVIITGGEGVISASVADEISAQVGTSPTRLFGQDQYDTQLAIYAYGADRSLWGSQAIVVSGVAGQFADALSAAPVAFAQKAPIFFVDETGSLPNKTIQTLYAASTLSSAVAVGGSAVVSEWTMGALEALVVNHGSARSNVVRLSGETLYDTSLEVAFWAVENAILSWDNAAFATGKMPYDALAGSVVQGRDRSVLLLADPGYRTAFDVLSRHSVTTYKYFGGKAVFRNADKVSYALKLGFPLSDIEGLIVYLDAGHGWNSSNNGVFDYGAWGCGYNEYDLNAELTGQIAPALRSWYGLDVYVNDDGGYYAYRQSEAYAMDCGVFVSIHFNSGGGSGTESYIHSYNAAPGASVLQSRVHPALISGVGLGDRGMKNEEFAVCGGKVPAVLLEVAFIDNQNDMNAYQSRKGNVAGKIAEGIAS